MFFLLVTLTELFVAGDLSGLLDDARMQRKIAQLKDHYLICGFGRVGRQVARTCSDAGRAVRRDRRQPRRARVRSTRWTCSTSRAGGSDDEVMLEAGHRARPRGDRVRRLRRREHLRDAHRPRAAARHPDRGARGRESSERKLIRAGANEVVSPYKTSGRTMASLALRLRADPPRRPAGPSPGRPVGRPATRSSSSAESSTPGRRARSSELRRRR